MLRFYTIRTAFIASFILTGTLSLIAQQAIELNSSSYPGSIPNGPTTNSQTVEFKENTSGTTFINMTYPISVTASFSNQQYTSVPGAPAGMCFGATIMGATSINMVPTPVWNRLDSKGSPSSSTFTSNPNGPAGTGIDVTRNYGFFIQNTTNMWYGTSGPAGLRAYYGDITFTFSRPVTDPVIHLSELGGHKNGDGFTTEFELPSGSGLTLTRLSGSSELSVPGSGDKILNSSSNPDAGCGSGAACGSVRINGANITSVTFRVYVRFENNNFPPLNSSSTAIGDALVISFSFVTYTLSGNVFDDGNGLTDNTVNGPGTNAGGSLYALAVDANGILRGSAPVSASGSYTLKDIFKGSYTFWLATSAGVLGSPAPASSLPANWVNTGEVIGTGPGHDGDPNGIIAVTVGNSNISNINFGIEQLPNTDDKSISYTFNTPGQQYAVPALSGSDFEDGLLGSGNRFRIMTLPSGAALRYNGASLTPGQLISNFNPSLLLIDPDDGVLSTSFTYAAYDAATKTDPSPATVSITWGQPANITISGYVDDDPNGMLDNVINGNAITSPSGVQLYVSLVNGSNTIIQTVPVTMPSPYSYSFNMASMNTNYTVVLSTNPAGSVTPSLPSGWVNTGETDGTGIPHDGNPNGITAVATGTSNIVGVDFGINMVPNSDNKNINYPFNTPGQQYAVPALSGSDFEDGILGTGHTYRINTLPSGAVLYYNGVAVTAGQLISNYNPSLLMIDPDNSTFLTSFTYSAIDAIGNEDPSPAVVDITWGQSAFIVLEGYVINDPNGLADNIVNGNRIASPSGIQLYVSLVDGSNMIIQTVPVTMSSPYSYYFNLALMNTSYTIVLSTNPSGSTTPSLPPGWVNTGETDATGTPHDGNPNGIIPITVGTSNMVGIDFAINEIPNSDDKSTSYPYNTPGQQYAVPALSGIDFEDGIMGAGHNYRINTLPSGAVLYYTGFPVSAGQLISNFNPSSLLIDPDNPTVFTSFTYSAIDVAGNQDPTPATVQITWGESAFITLSGYVVNDANGLSDGVVNGPAINSPSGTQLYVSLVDGANTIIQTVPVIMTGPHSYIFNQSLRSTNYTIVLSTNPSGSTTPSLPSRWVNTGENIGIVTGNDGNPNGIIAVAVANSSIVDIDFGIDEMPVAYDINYTLTLMPAVNSSMALNGAIGSPIVGLTPIRPNGSDPEDGVLESGKHFVVNTLPTNGTLNYNDMAVTAGQSITGFDPDLLTIQFTGSGYSSVSFTYSYRDAAGISSLPATYILDFPAGSSLPVIFTDFTATLQNGDEVLLKWQTSSEQNNRGFHVQHSTDGRSWETLDFVAGAGSSNTVSAYSYVHRNVSSGRHYYRLQQEDTDGKIKLSHTRLVNIGGKYDLQVYPNPAQNGLYIVPDSRARISEVTLLDITGRQVLIQKYLQNGLPLDISRLKADTYLLKVQYEDGETSYKKVIKR